MYCSNENISNKQKIKFDNIQSKLLIISSWIGIQNIIKSLTIKVIINDITNNGKEFLAQSTFNAEKLFTITKV